MGWVAIVLCRVKDWCAGPYVRLSRDNRVLKVIACCQYAFDEELFYAFPIKLRVGLGVYLREESEFTVRFCYPSFYRFLKNIYEGIV